LEENSLTITDEALLLESQILALQQPNKRSLAIFRRWFDNSARPVLWGRDEQLFDNENDLVSLAPVDTDRLNIFLRTYIGWFFKVRLSAMGFDNPLDQTNSEFV
jgi:hypothetical protein